MTKQEIEKEIQARIDFKFDQLIKVVESEMKTNWILAFQTNAPKYVHYYQAFEMFRLMVEKEANMGPPVDEMARERKRIAKDKAVKKIMDNVFPNGHRHRGIKTRLVVSCIEEAQNY